MFSLGKLAELISFFRRTLYGCERSTAKASVSAAYNLASVLGVPVAKHVNLLKKTWERYECLLTKAKHAIARQPVLQKIIRNLLPVHLANPKNAIRFHNECS